MGQMRNEIQKGQACKNNIQNNPQHILDVFEKCYISVCFLYALYLKIQRCFSVLFEKFSLLKFDFAE